MGFSLLELVVALALMMILSLMAVSGWQHFVHDERASIALQQMAAAINFARIEAIRRGEPLVFCKSSDHRNCGGQWRDGQLIVSTSGEVLQVLNALPLGDTLVWRSSFGRNDALELLPSGYTSGQQGRFYYCFAGQNAELMPTLVVNQAGRVRIEYVNKPCLFSEQNSL